MRIMGLQKLTLLDYPGKIATTVFLGGCDMACPYCHNAELLDFKLPAMISQEDFFSFLKKRQGFIDAVCISGGEPLVNKDLEYFLRKIKDMGFLLKLDTNGSRPDQLRKILDTGLLNYLAMDIKNDKETYAETAGVLVDTDKIDRSIKMIMEEGRENPDFSYEFRTTITKKFHNANSFKNIAEWISGADAYYLQAFRVSENVPDKSLGSPSLEDLTLYKNILDKKIKKVEIREMD